MQNDDDCCFCSLLGISSAEKEEDLRGARITMCLTINNKVRVRSLEGYFPSENLSVPNSFYIGHEFKKNGVDS